MPSEAATRNGAEEQRQMLTIQAIKKAIEMYEGGATESAVANVTGIRPEEAGTVAEALNLGEAERLLREVALAGVLEAAAAALRSGRGLIGDAAGDVIREIWNCYPGAGLKTGETHRPAPIRAKPESGNYYERHLQHPRNAQRHRRASPVRDPVLRTDWDSSSRTSDQ